MKKNSTEPLLNKYEKRGKSFQKLKTVLFLVCFLLFSITSYAQQQQRFTLSMQKVSLKQVMDYVKEKSAYYFLYQDNDISNIKNITIDATNCGINELLDQALKETPMEYSIQDKTITLRKKSTAAQKTALQQKTTMSGKITDKEGEPIPGASVQIKGTSIGTSTDADGKYSLTTENPNAILVISFIGMQTQELSVKQGEKNIILLEDQTVLDEVVITGYQKLGVNQAAGSFNTIKMSDFEKKISSNLTSTIEGLSPSLVVSSEPGGRKVLTIRGISTLEGSSSPLIIVDGFPYNDDLSTINPYDIESITLLKDAASASIYGAKSANGVIVITTKRGKKGDLEIRYMSTTQVSEQPDIDYLMNRVSSSDMVDIERAYFETNKDKLQSYQYYVETANPYAQYYIAPPNRVVQLYIAQKEGRISQAELDKQLNLLRSSNNRDDLKKLLLQTPFFTEHSLAASYGGSQFRLRTSLNYFSNKSGFKGSSTEGVRYSLNSVFDISDKFRLDLLANFNLGKDQSYKDSPFAFLRLSPYEKFYDDAGKPLAVTLPAINSSSNNQGVSGGKDPYEIQRLLSLGLLDETYYPASDYGLSRNYSDYWNARFQAQMRLKIVDGLDGVFGFNINKRANLSKEITDKNSWEMKSFLNNLTSVIADGKKGELTIPYGSRIKETRGDITNYLLRGQLDFNKSFGESSVIALIGSEIQVNKLTSTTVDRLGYDERSNTFKDVDYLSLGKDMENKFIPRGNIPGGIPFSNNFSDIENRYFSFYANSNYTYKNKYVLSGSMRIDQSNLFGTDPKYRFKPFWSLGSKWRMAEEDFFGKEIFSKFDWQMSYGVNGNISNDFGPFDITYLSYIYRANLANGLVISSYVVPDLRWEKTGTFNIGLHTQLFDDRFSLSFDYYRKHTKDVLADAESDPTLGSTYVKRNDATITNNGYELALSGTIIKLRDFQWNGYLNYNYNKSKVEKIFETDERAYYIAGKVKNRLGYEPQSIFVFDWAGVDKDGNGLVKRANGDLTAISPTVYEGGTFSPTDLLHEDLLHAGTILPKHVMGLTSNFIYKDFSLSFMFVYQGGHVMIRDSYNAEYVGSVPASINAEASQAWKVSGDENKTGVPRWSSAMYESIARSSTKNIIPGDFLRLRDVILSYTLPRNSLTKVGIKELTINLTGKNLFLWTKNKYGIDPETQGLGQRMFPIGKSFTAGLNVTF